MIKKVQELGIRDFQERIKISQFQTTIQVAYENARTNLPSLGSEFNRYLYLSGLVASHFK